MRMTIEIEYQFLIHLLLSTHHTITDLTPQQFIDSHTSTHSSYTSEELQVFLLPFRTILSSYTPLLPTSVPHLNTESPYISSDTPSNSSTLSEPISVEPEFVRPPPPVFQANTDELVWLNYETEPDLLWDFAM